MIKIPAVLYKILVIGIIFLFIISTLVLMSVGYDIKVSDVKQQKPIKSSYSTPPEEEWNKTYGGTKYDYSHSGRQTTDSGYIITGYAYPYGAGGSADVWLLKVAAENQPPNKPSIDGQTSGKAGKEYEYTFNAIDPDGDDIRYFIDWGDNTTGEWTDFNASATDIKVKHTWSEDGTYNISAKAQDEYGADSQWATLEVTIPRNRSRYYSLFQLFFERFPLLEVFLRAMNLLR